MATLATLPASITVTNQLSTDLILGPAGWQPKGGGRYDALRLGPNGSAEQSQTITLNGLPDGTKTYLWELIVTAHAAGHITANETVDPLTDGVEHGHTEVNGQNEPGTTSPDSL